LFLNGYIYASESGDLNDNPKPKLFPKTDMTWQMMKIDAEHLRFQLHVLRLLRQSAKEEAIQVLEAELLESGSRLKSKTQGAQSRGDYEIRLQHDINVIIGDFDNYKGIYQLKQSP